MAEAKHCIRTFRKAVAVVAAAVLLFGCAGQNLFPAGPEVKAKGGILFVPFKDASSYYYDSPAGIAVADRAAEAVAVNVHDVSAVPCESARGQVRSSVMDKKTDWTKVGRGCGADYVVYGSIDRISWSDPSDPAIPRCFFTITYSVYDVSKSADIYRVTKSGKYPPGLFADKGVTTFEMGAEGFRIRALQYIGEVVGRTFYTIKLSDTEADSLTTTTHALGR